jgi:hypothetical protein
MRYPHPFGDLFAKRILSDDWYVKSLFEFLINRKIKHIERVTQEKIEQEDREEKLGKSDLRKLLLDFAAKVTDENDRELTIFMEVQQTNSALLAGRLQRYYSFHYRIEGEGNPLRLHAILLIGFDESDQYGAITQFETIATDYKTGKKIASPHEGLGGLLTHDLTIINGKKLRSIKHLPIYDLLFIFDASNYRLDPKRKGRVIFKNQPYNMTQQQLFGVMNRIIEDEIELEIMLKDAETQATFANFEQKAKEAQMEVADALSQKAAAQAREAAAQAREAAAERDKEEAQAQNEEVIRTSVIALHGANFSPEQIAEHLKLPLSKVLEVLG